MTNNNTAVYTAAKSYIASGLSVIPIKPDGSKAPPISWKPFQSRIANDAELNQWFSNGNGLAIISGKISGNLEILDIDAPELFEPFCELVREIAPDLLERLPIVKTPSPGYQISYRCEKVEGNQKLSERKVDNENGKSKYDVLFETRGEGGYVVAPPSPSSCHPAKRPYELLQGDLNKIPVITLEERDILLTCARSFDEKEIQEEKAQDNEARKIGLTRPGDDYNANFSLQQWHELLERHGWKKTTRRGETEYWQRPGKKEPGISATVNYKGSNLFYVFSTNAYPFDGQRAYTPFQALTLLEHDGDFRASAKALVEKGYGEKLSKWTYENGKMIKQSEILKSDRGDKLAFILNVLTGAPLTDVGNAECLSAIYSNDLRYCHTRKNWLIWDGIRWIVDNCERSRKMSVDMIRARHQAALQMESSSSMRELVKWALQSENIIRINAALKLAQSIEPFATTIERFDSDPLLATTKNGTLDLQNVAFRESNLEDYLSMRLGAEFRPDAVAPRWKQFLDEVFNGDKELIEYIQTAFGYSLTGETKEQVMFLCYGSGANGKSKLLEILGYLLGEYAGAASFEAFNAGNRNDAGYDLAVLKGKRVVTVIETNEDRKLDEAKVKAVTGQDEISCRFLYGNFFTYRPQFKIWMAMNHKPYITGTDNGIWRRLHLIPFTQSFKGSRDDKDLIHKLRDELSGILNWSLEGLKKWHEKGLVMPKAVNDATEEYRRESDSIGQWIVEKTLPKLIGKLRANEAYHNYTVWALSRGEKPFGVKKWGNSLSERGYKRDHDREGNFYMGLELLP